MNPLINQPGIEVYHETPVPDLVSCGGTATIQARSCSAAFVLLPKFRRKIEGSKLSKMTLILQRDFLQGLFEKAWQHSPSPLCKGE